jgi:hypothetical protein
MCFLFSFWRKSFGDLKNSIEYSLSFKKKLSKMKNLKKTIMFLRIVQASKPGYKRILKY